MISESNFLDLGNLFIFELFGAPVLFVIVGLAVLNYHLVKQSFPFQVNVVASFLWIGLVTSYIYNAFLWMLGLFVIGLVIYGLYTKIIKR